MWKLWSAQEVPFKLRGSIYDRKKAKFVNHAHETLTHLNLHSNQRLLKIRKGIGVMERTRFCHKSSMTQKIKKQELSFLQVPRLYDLSTNLPKIY